MFIITSIITLPLGFIGFTILPGTPDKPSKRFLTERDLDLARSRLQRHGVRLTTHAFNFKLIGRIFSSWKIYVLIIWDVLFWNRSLNSSSGGYLLWLKSLHRYSTSKLNNLGSISPALGIFYVLFIYFGSDLFLGRAGATTLRPHLEPHWSHHYHSLEYSRMRPLVCFQHDIFVSGNVVSVVWLGE